MPTFIAFICDPGVRPPIDNFTAGCAPASMRHYDLAEGRLTLCNWSHAATAADTGENILVELNKTRSPLGVSVPTHCVDDSVAPMGLLREFSQFRSYLYLDKERRTVFWTDHIGFSPIFCRTMPGCQVFSDDPHALCTGEQELDLGMVASYLLNGLMLSGRTLFDGIRSLPPACVVTASPRACQPRPYWRFAPGLQPTADHPALQNELWLRIKTAIRNHTGDSGIMLPLSGGYDSSCLLGSLAESGQAVSSFTYVAQAPRRGSDADVALRQTKLLGTDHRALSIGWMGILEMLETNVRCGLTMRNPCYEIGAYADAAEIAENKLQNPIFCIGDECFGWSSYRLNGDSDMLGSILLRAPEKLSVLDPILGRTRGALLRNGLAQTYRSLLEGAPRGWAPDDIKDWLFLKVRVAASLAPLRVHSAGSFLPFVCPFLDISILDLMRHMGSADRVDKALIKTIVRRQLPHVYRIPRARVGQGEPDFRKMAEAGKSELRTHISDLQVGIPGVMTPAELGFMLEALIGKWYRSQSPLTAGTKAGSLASEAVRAANLPGMLPAQWQTRLRRRFFNRFYWKLGYELLFVRALHLAMVFERERRSTGMIRSLSPPFYSAAGQ